MQRRMPHYMEQFITYVRRLGAHDTPDYGHLASLLNRALLPPPRGYKALEVWHAQVTSLG
jgi:hypothetical protein